ncbi:MAG TPA: GntR family transcriptional regulator [Terriglobales bacterium]|nr:GntR family transcriptional regulator [Terriglobales bacterium]
MADQNSHRQSDAAYEQLRDLVIRAEIKPGVLLEEPALMELLGVGRTPLREALQRLAQEDLIRNVPRRGYFVTEISPADLFHVFEVRQNLEAMAAALAAERANDSHFAEFDRLLAEAREGIAADNQDLAWNLGLDERFHLLIASATDNPYLVRAITRHYGLSVRTLYLSRVPITLVKDEIENFDAVFGAIRARDPQRAEAAMRKHLEFNPLTIMVANTGDRRTPIGRGAAE